MKTGQDLIKQHKLKNRDIFNFDESGITYTTMPRYMYVPDEQQRASGHGFDKARVTSIFMANADGELAPLAVIMRCKGSENPDQTGMRVVDLLHKKAGLKKNRRLGFKGMATHIDATQQENKSGDQCSQGQIPGSQKHW